MKKGLQEFINHIAPLNNSYNVDEEGIITFQIVDLEMDAIDITIMDIDEGEIEINTEGYSFLTLDLNLLGEIISRVKEIQKKEG
jgi:predicted nucleic acid-binding protein